MDKETNKQTNRREGESLKGKPDSQTLLTYELKPSCKPQ